MEQTTPVQSAEATGRALLDDLKTGLDTLITNLDGDVVTAEPSLSTDALALLEEFIPTAWRGVVVPIVNSFVSGEKQMLDGAVQSVVKGALGVALIRVNALL